MIKHHLTVLFVLVCQLMLANISAPPKPDAGNITGQGRFQSISVLNEDLTIDLLGVTKGENAKIRAYYKIYTPIPIYDLELIFVANNLTKSKFSVELDDEFVNGFIKKFDKIPNSWLPPDSISFQAGKIPFQYTHKGLISFTIDSISSGEHTLEVSYEANVSEWFERGDLSVTRTFVYILRPYEGWKEFKNLNLNLSIPSDWDYSSNLNLDRDETQVIHGFWEDLPAHHLAIAFKPKEGCAIIYSILFVLFAGLSSVMLLIFWMSFVIKFRLRNQNQKIIQTSNNVFVSFIATVLFYVIYFSEPALKNYLLDNQLNPFYTRGIGYFILAFPFVLIIALMITFLVDYFLTGNIKK